MGNVFSWISALFGGIYYTENSDKKEIRLLKNPYNFFCFPVDDQYWAVSGYSIEAGFPKPIQNLGFPTSVRKIDAAVHDHSTKRTYFFVGNKYWR